MPSLSKQDFHWESRSGQSHVWQGDCRVIVPKLVREHGLYDFIFADPPFNIGQNYSGYKDSVERTNYITFMAQWIEVCVAALRPGGVIALHGPDDLAELYIACMAFTTLPRIAWINWHYRFGQCNRSNWIDARCHCLLYSSGDHTWNPEAVLVDSDRVAYGDNRVKKTVVVNHYKESFEVNIMRPSKWGNPFVIGKDGTRGEVIEKFRVWFPEQPQFKDIKELCGKRLGCCCKPQACHGDLLAEWANELTGGKRLPGTVWGVPSDGPYWGRVQGNSKERRPAHPNQLPEVYLERLLKAYTNTGDKVLDPFAGSGTTITVAAALGRQCDTIDVSRASCQSVVERLSKGSTRVSV